LAAPIPCGARRWIVQVVTEAAMSYVKITAGSRIRAFLLLPIAQGGGRIDITGVVVAVVRLALDHHRPVHTGPLRCVGHVVFRLRPLVLRHDPLRLCIDPACLVGLEVHRVRSAKFRIPVRVSATHV
jgi:hypothetical protein